MKIFVDCEEAGHVCDKAQYKEAPFFEKLMLGIHTLYCKACREHSKRNTKLTKVMDMADIQTIEPSKKQAMRDLVAKECSK